jgi:hypothetical protein
MEVGSKMASHGNLKGLMEDFIEFMEANTKKWGPSHHFVGELENLGQVKNGLKKKESTSFQGKRIEGPSQNAFSSINSREKRRKRSYQNPPNGKQANSKVVVNCPCRPHHLALQASWRPTIVK